MANLTITPRLLRQATAPAYLGMSEPEFNQRVRPYVTEIKAEGGRAVFYDREELDEWVDAYKATHATPQAGQPDQDRDTTTWQNPHRALESGATSGTLKKSLQGSAFAKALKKRNLKMQSNT